LLPAIILILAVIIFPLFKGISFAFTNKFLTTADYDFVGLQQFQRLINDSQFWLALKNTVIWTILGVAGQLVLGFIFAYLLTRSLRGERILRGLLLIPWAVPTIATSIIWLWLYNPMYGYIKYYLSLVNLPQIYFLSNTKIALLSVILPLIWRGTFFVMLVYISGFQSLNEDLYEAAEIDGANTWRKLRFLTIPLLSPLTKVLVLLLTMWTFNVFDYIWIMTKGGPAGYTHLLSTYSYYNAFLGFNIGYGSAIGVVIFLILIIVSFIYIRAVYRTE